MIQQKRCDFEMPLGRGCMQWRACTLGDTCIHASLVPQKQVHQISMTLLATKIEWCPKETVLIAQAATPIQDTSSQIDLTNASRQMQ
jgi:hypothetical protein